MAVGDMPVVSRRGLGAAMSGVPFWDRVDKTGGLDSCWPWTGAKNRQGYGNWWDPERRKYERPHRHAARLAFGDLGGKWVLHECDNPACCNPLHLSLGDHVENMRQMRHRGRSRRGERNVNAVVTSEQEGQIMEARGYQREIAERFGVGVATVQRVRSQNEAELKFLPCPDCGGRLITIETTPRVVGQGEIDVRRRRECRECGERFTTRESFA